MDTRVVDQILQTTFEDRQLSRSERTALAGRLAELITSDRDLAAVRSRAFALVEATLRSGSEQRSLAWLEEVVKLLMHHQPPGPQMLCEAVFSPGEICARRLGERLRATRRSADICVFTVTDDRVTREILACHRREVAVRLITDDAKAWDPGSDVTRLVDAGVSVVTDSSPAHMHHKFAIFDRRIVATGSYNWTRSAGDVNQENLLFCDHPPLVRQYLDEFEGLWARFSRV